MDTTSPIVHTLNAGEWFILNTPGRYYRVIKGNLIVYIGKYQNGSPGERLPGSLFKTGSTLFSIEPHDIGLFARAEDQVLLEDIPVSDQTLLGDFGTSWAAWIQNPLFQGKKPLYSDTKPIDHDEMLEDVHVRINTRPGAIPICQVSFGTVHDTSSDMVFTRDEGWFVVPPEWVFFVPEKAEIKISPLSEFNTELFVSDLDATCRRWTTRLIEKRWADADASDHHRFTSWNQQELQVRKLISQGSREGDPDSDEILSVFNRLLQAIGVSSPDISPMSLSGLSNSDPFTILTKLSEHYRVRIRRVKLSETWWKEDNGPLLVVDTQGKILAAIPDKPGHYLIFDACRAIDSSENITPDSFCPEGYMVYPSLPERVLQISDVAFLIWNAIWKRDIVTFIIFGILAGILSIAMPLGTGIIFNDAIPDSDSGLLITIIVILLCTLVSSVCFQVTQAFAIIRMEGKIGSVFEAAIWDRLLKLPPSFFRQYSAGELTSRVEIADGIRTSISSVAISLILGFIFSVCNGILMVFISPGLALYTLGFVMGIFCITILFGYLSFQERRKFLLKDGHLSGITFQILSSIAKISSAGAENRAYLRWKKDYVQQNSISLNISIYNEYSLILNFIWPGLLTILIFALTGDTILNSNLASTVHSEFTGGWFLAFFTATLGFSLAFSNMSTALISLWNIKPMWDYMNPILATPSEVHEGQIHPGVLTGSIEVNHVTFRYNEKSSPVLHDVSLKVDAGAFIAIVGASGSGKSSLLRLLLGFETPESGAILYEGQNLTQLNIRDLRRQIGVVLQDGQLMADSISNNIAGARTLSLEEIWEAATMAGIADDIRQMPMGMYTYVNEGAANISGGQKQRILIARALATKPRILFLDEATSALDNASQNIVKESLEHLQLTRIIIAHRLSSITHADRIYVLDNGRIIEEGTYDELIKKGGTFTRLAQRQIA